MPEPEEEEGSRGKDGAPRRRRKWPGRALLACAVVTVLAGAAVIALVLLPPVSWQAWQYALLALEFSLFLAVLAALGVLLALASRHRLALWVAGANAVVLVLALVPSAALWSTARSEGASLSLGEYTAGLAASTDRDPVTLEYTEVDGEPLELDVWEPAERDGDDPLPVVVNIHGGAEDLSQSLLPRWDTWLADQGHVVFDVDYRYFPEGEWSAPVSDVRCALGWIVENAHEYGADPERLAVTGQSAGGLLALLATYAPDEEIPPSCEVDVPEADAVMAWYSVADGTSGAPEVPWRQRHSPMGDDLLENQEHMMGGSEAEVPEEYAAISPLTHVDADTPPTLLLTPEHDLFLDAEDNRRLAARLQAEGVPHQHVELPWVEHMFDLNWGGLASQIARHSIGDFLAEHLHR